MSDDLSHKQEVNAIYDRGNYAEIFERDLIEADQEIIIASPSLRYRKVERILSLLKPRQESGVKITIITLFPDSSRFDNVEDISYILSRIRSAGIEVALTESESEHFAVIDRKLVWHGGVNLLGKEDAWDNLIRIESVKAAAELVEMTHEESQNSTSGQ